MEQGSAVLASPSRPTWETLETFAREQVRAFVQALLEEEITTLLGRTPSQRRAAVDAPAGHRNGYGKPRRLAMQAGTITVRRPRVRGVAGRVESRILPLFQRRTQAVGALLPDLYLHGLAQGRPASLTAQPRGSVTTLTAPDGGTLAYTYDGALVTSETWGGPAGAVTDRVDRTYDPDFRIASESVNGANPVTFGYDPDSLLTQAGAWSACARSGSARPSVLTPRGRGRRPHRQRCAPPRWGPETYRQIQQGPRPLGRLRSCGLPSAQVMLYF